jgi:tRNA dimethylallyltransferase
MSIQNTLVIMGPTASGKSDLSLALARKYNGEIISADSRQVYRGMDIGTGKVTKAEQKQAQHWLIDVASPKRSYNVTHFVRDAKKAIADMKKRGKTPVICGGTGFWIQALLEGDTFPAVKPNRELRKKLEKRSTEALFKELKKKDPKRAQTIDPKNKIRLIRALEIIATLGKVPAKQKSTFNNDVYIILALVPPLETLHKKIALRLEKRLKQGMVAEVKRLRKEGLSWKKLESFGLEYKYVALFLQKKISKENMKERLNTEIRHYAKRQLTWLRRFEKTGAHIHWISDPKEAVAIIEKSSD